LGALLSATWRALKTTKFTWTPGSSSSTRKVNRELIVVFVKTPTLLDTSLMTGVPKEVIESEIMPNLWKKYPPQHPLIGIALCFAMFLLLLLNVSANGSVVWAYIRCPELKKTPVSFAMLNAVL